MMDPKRKEVVDAVVADLSKAEGMNVAWSDDFNSHAVDIFVRPEVDSRACNNKPNKFVLKDVRKIKQVIKDVCKNHNLTYNFLDYPVVEYEYDNYSKKNIRKGYDQELVKLEIFV